MRRNFERKVQSTRVEVIARSVKSRLRMDVLWPEQFIDHNAEMESEIFIVSYVRIFLQSADGCYIVTVWLPFNESVPRTTG